MWKSLCPVAIRLSGQLQQICRHGRWAFADLSLVLCQQLVGYELNTQFACVEYSSDPANSIQHSPSGCVDVWVNSDPGERYEMLIEASHQDLCIQNAEVLLE